MDSITKIKKYGKNYHKQYYHEKRKQKLYKGEYNKTVNTFYTLSEIERHLNDYFECLLIKEYNSNIPIIDDINAIKEIFILDDTLCFDNLNFD